MNNYVQLGDLIKTISKTHKFEKAELIFLNTSDVSKGNILINHYTPVSELKGQAKKSIQNEDILYSEIRPKNRRYAYVKNLYNPEDYVVSTKLMVLRNASTKLNTDYLYHFLTSEETINYLQRRAENRIGSFPQITFDVLKKIKILLPELAVQIKIAKILSDLDIKIEINNRINTELEAMAKTLYDYWFVQFDFPDANGKPYKTNSGKMVWNQELNREIPEGWEVKTLLDIATFVNGLACQKFRPTGNEEYYRVIKIREMGTGFTENSEFVSRNIPEKVVIHNGDILFSWSATLDVKIWTGGTGALNQHIFKISSDNFPKSFYYFELLNYLQHFKMQAELRKTTMGHITQDHLRQSRITIPPLNLINKLEKILKPILIKKIKLEEENQEIASLRDWLLPMLMNGQVSVGEDEEQLGMVAEEKEEYKKG